jgi:hypothetical protein
VDGAEERGAVTHGARIRVDLTSTQVRCFHQTMRLVLLLACIMVVPRLSISSATLLPAGASSLERAGACGRTASRQAVGLLRLRGAGDIPRVPVVDTRPPVFRLVLLRAKE